MMQRTTVPAALADFLTAAGFSWASGAWYRPGGDVITVIDVQKSQYGPQYYVNLALWLKALGRARRPKEQDCHVRTRLCELMGDDDRHELTLLLDPDATLTDDDRRTGLAELLDRHLTPILESSRSLDALRSPAGQDLVRVSLVTREARDVLGC